MRTFQDATNAENKSIGFDYQYYYFIYQLLGLEEGQKIGLEVKDDVHLELANEKQVLLQLKHSIQTTSLGKTVNLTERDGDLWKTIYNWVNIINDPVDRRAKRDEQYQFLNKTTFILVSNKASNSSNLFLKKTKDFKQGVVDVREFKHYLGDLQSTTADKEICGYIELLKKQPLQWLAMFLRNLEFELDQDDLITKIKSRIKGKQVKEVKIDDVFNAIDSNIRKKNYINIKSKNKIVISFEDFYREYHVYFDKGRNEKLPINKKPINFDRPIEDQLFIKQLIDIIALEKNDRSEMLRLTGHMLQTNNHLSDWVNKGLIVQEQLEEFNEECIVKWKNTHDEVHREINLDLKMFSKNPSERDIILSGLNCLDEVRKKELVIDETPLDTELSNGQFYLLSNKPSIGWRIDWEGKYKK